MNEYTCESKYKTKEYKSFFDRIKCFFGRCNERNKCMSAEEAYFKSMYGQYMSPENRIKCHQENISSMIKSKCYQSLKGDTDFSSFYCVYDFNEDMKEYIDDVFKPFKEKGYNIISLSDKVSEINRSNVFLISWDRKKKRNNRE